MRAFDKVIGYESIKEELIRICDVLKDPEKYKKLGVEPSHGVLLYGNPGLGKSLMARCFIEESGVNNYTLRKDMPSDAFVEEIKRTFDLAKENSPAIVFLDDMDKLNIPVRRSRHSGKLETVNPEQGTATPI
ncbi:ATPase family associated with various cellular activities (AAA) [Lachnospiraceae bacterium XBB2008]|nr:ATPase family associated with various cellular activities (AAA) [Lachnospiraceae bacterium XBB2008]